LYCISGDPDEHRSPICKQNKWRLWLFFPTHAFVLPSHHPNPLFGWLICQPAKGDTAGNSAL
jgi:hypothetical protein